MVLAVGEVLMDVFPGYARIGGAPFNYACHLKSLGIDVRFAGRVGADGYAGEIRRFMAARGMDVGLLQTDSSRRTGRVLITLDREGSPRFEIEPDAAYDFLEPSGALIEAAGSADLICYGTLAQRTPRARESLHAVLDSSAGAVLLYDMNLRSGNWNRETVLRSLERCDILKLNDEECAILMSLFDFHGAEDIFINRLMGDQGLSMVAVTRGGSGSSIYTGEGRFNATPHPVEVVDTVGAGDAFAAMMSAGRLWGWPMERVIESASALASRVCGIEGALPLNDDFYADFRML